MKCRKFKLNHRQTDVTFNVHKISNTYSQFILTVDVIDSPFGEGYTVVQEGSVTLVDGVSFIIQNGFYNFPLLGNVNYEYSYVGMGILFQPGETHIFTITSGTGRFLGCEGFIKYFINADGSRDITFKICTK